MLDFPCKVIPLTVLLYSLFPVPARLLPPHHRYCVLAFDILRKNANLILNLLSLMADANIPHMASDPEKSILRVQDKFKLELTDEEAEQYILGVVDMSLTAFFSTINDRLHTFAISWKS